MTNQKRPRSKGQEALVSSGLLTLVQLADVLGVTPSALSMQAWRGQLPLEVVRLTPHGRRYVRTADVRRWLGLEVEAS